MNFSPRSDTFATARNDIRRRERRAVSMRGYVLRPDGTGSEMLLLDLSYEGCGVQTVEQLKPGEIVKLSILRRGAIDAQVRWCDDGKAGLVFLADETTEREQRPRKTERISTTAEVVVRRLGGASYRVRVTDLSTHGCKVELVERPRVGEHILVKIPGIETLEADVCWVERFNAGLEFEKPIHPAVFDLLLQRLKVH